MMMSKKHIKFSDQIRQAVKDSGLSQKVICKRIEIGQASFSRFMHDAGLRLSTLDRLADEIGFEITIRPKKGAK